MVKNVPNSEKEFSFNYLEQISIYPLLSEEQEKKLFLQYQKDGDLDAYWSLYFCNLRLSVFSAKKEYKNFINIDFWDLVQENNLILMKIIKNYDLSKGKFSTYALNVMHNQLREYIIDYETSISVKYKKSDEYRKYQRILKENRKQGKEPLEEEILSQIKIEKKALKSLKYAEGVSVCSLNQKIRRNNEDNKIEIQDTLEDVNEAYEKLERKIDLFQLIKIIIDNIDKRKYYIIYHHYLSEDPKTIETLAKELGISFQAVNQQEKIAFTKIKSKLLNSSKENQNVNISKLLHMSFYPLSPKIITTMHYLKETLEEEEYEAIYKKYIDENTGCWKTKNNLKNCNMPLEHLLFNKKIQENIFNLYCEKYRIVQIFNLNILPEREKENHLPKIKK